MLFAVNSRRRARTLLVWKLGLLAGEYGVFFIFPALALAGLAMVEGRAGIPAALCCAVACVFFLIPETLSRRMRRELPGRLKEAFGPRAKPGKERFRAGRVRTVIFTGAGGAPRRIRFYPTSRPAAPCVILIHSGGWESGTPDEFPRCTRDLARSGFAVAAIEYGLAPESPWPGPREDVRSAIVRLREDAGTLGIAADNFVLFGRSAGGQIALCVAYDRPPPGVRGVVSYYAPTDMRFAWRGSYDGDILDSPKLLKNYLGGRPHETPEIHLDASPTEHAAAGRVLPTLLIHGARDELVRHLHQPRLVRHLARTGTPHLAIVPVWARHGFDYRHAGPGGRVARHALIAFLEAVTHTPAAAKNAPG